MKKYTDSSKLNYDLKHNKIKEGETIILDERLKRDAFFLSEGDLKVLECIPKMMRLSEFRKDLRLLTLKYLTKEIKDERKATNKN